MHLNYPNQIHYIDKPFGEITKRRSVYLDGAAPFYQNSQDNPITKVAPAPHDRFPPRQYDSELNSALYDTLKPMIFLLKITGVFPISFTGPVVSVSPHLVIYSLVIFIIIAGYIGYIKWDKVELIKSAEGRFEEAVIDYLFTIYLIPIILNPIFWYEARKHAKVLTDIVAFERVYYRVAKKDFVDILGKKPMIITIMLPILSMTTMIVTHITMAHFKLLQVVPYCYINMITYLLGGGWYLYCNLIGKAASTIAVDFQEALKNIGPSKNVADYRSLWMMLSKITRDVGNAFGYCLAFLCLYLFLIITLTIYGLFSQIQEGLGVKDIGLTITAFSAGLMLFFISDEAHYASNRVRVQFQKKLLLVELAWMNDNAQQEIHMFVRATEMNPTDMTLVGFFVVNRNLFKSLIATMVTYLVVLLQFQISIPEDTTQDVNNSTQT